MVAGPAEWAVAALAVVAEGAGMLLGASKGPGMTDGGGSDSSCGGSGR